MSVLCTSHAQYTAMKLINSKGNLLKTCLHIGLKEKIKNTVI